jgi:hypothetical protein
MNAIAVRAGAQARFAFERGSEPRFALALIGGDPALPWFVRGYGLAARNPIRERTVAANGK